LPVHSLLCCLRAESFSLRNPTGTSAPKSIPIWLQRLSQQAWDKIVAAQEANEWDMKGHAQKAKELLDQANKELKEAAEAANAAK